MRLTYLQTKMRFCEKALRCKCNKDSTFVYKYHIQNKNLSTVINTQTMRKNKQIINSKNYEL